MSYEFDPEIGLLRSPVRVAPQHVCHLYEQDGALIETTTAFLDRAFATGEAIVAIGTQAHLDEITRRLSLSHDVGAARTDGRFLTLDAATALDRLMVHGMPDRARFLDAVGVPVADALLRCGGVRAFGEMVSLLWRRNDHEAALRLESLWNELMGSHPVALLCAYDTAGPVSGLAAAVARHSRLISRPAA